MSLGEAMATAFLTAILHYEILKELNAWLGQQARRRSKSSKGLQTRV